VTLPPAWRLAIVAEEADALGGGGGLSLPGDTVQTGPGETAPEGALIGET